MLVAPPSVDWTHRGLDHGVMASIAKDAGLALSKATHLRDGLQPPSTDSLPRLSTGLNGDHMHHLRSHQQLRIKLPLGTGMPGVFILMAA